MDAQHLHAGLRELHKELRQIESVDADERRALQQLMLKSTRYSKKKKDTRFKSTASYASG
jgi:hypothetical protein